MIPYLLMSMVSYKILATSVKIWHQTLKRAGLKRRRAYETRHTAAVLHLAAHENSRYVSQLLGHSNTKLLFEVCAPYVVNASRQDGSAFSKMMLSGGMVPPKYN